MLRLEVILVPNSKSKSTSWFCTYIWLRYFLGIIFYFYNISFTYSLLLLTFVISEYAITFFFFIFLILLINYLFWFVILPPIFHKKYPNSSEKDFKVDFIINFYAHMLWMQIPFLLFYFIFILNYYNLKNIIIKKLYS